MTGPEGECMGVWKDSGAFNSFTMLRLGVLGDSRVGRSLPLLDFAACTLQLRMLCPHTTHPHVYVHIYMCVCMYVWMDGCALCILRPPPLPPSSPQLVSPAKYKHLPGRLSC